MAVESPIDEDAEVFVGEHKVLRWTVRDKAKALVDPSGFAMRLTIYRRRNPVPVVTNSSVTGTSDGKAVATLTAEQSIALGAGSHRYLLERTDSGAEAVLAYGSLVLKERMT